MVLKHAVNMKYVTASALGVFAVDVAPRTVKAKDNFSAGFALGLFTHVTNRSLHLRGNEEVALARERMP